MVFPAEPGIETHQMQTADQLNEEFAIPGLLTFEEASPGMPRGRVTIPACTAEFYLQGAHLTAWQPSGQQPVLFLSSRSAIEPGKAIRGGIPVIFPWFGAPEASPVPTPAGAKAHGIARTSPWLLHFAALAGDDLHLSLVLDAPAELRAAGFGDLQLGLDLILGSELTVRLTVACAQQQNTARPLLIEEALHSYLLVGSVQQVAVEGLAGTDYLDKTDSFRRKTESGERLTFTGEIDRPYLNTASTVTLVDPSMGRRLVVSKTNSNSTVIWNPAAALASTLHDLAPGDWQHFACIETANVAENAIKIHPGEAHTMSMHLRVEPA